jgi:hypothetical protein
LSGEQVTDVTDIEIVRSVRDGRLRVPQIAFGCGYERFELIFLLPCAFDQALRVVSKVGELFRSKPERHCSRSSAVAIRFRKLGG